ncbi:phosphoethanolamine--lipid A transferase EptA [Apibacter muscae]|uniref:Phosphoethanolamine--lipid A transferase EptA n=1 Tax=Apibacter muscae TaxID=2509004 RepID=A0A563DL35_9FLAO|nr:phosphoethanolamine--lipid A transferase EptA [Apibacter muscae]TWP30593.1 phosphoethanolamine--lipid A transferase EptA [Apibacter muscae]
MLKNSLKISNFAILVSLLNFLLYHLPFFKFVFKNVDYKSLSGIILIASLVVVMLVANYFVFYLLTFLSRYIGKTLIILTFIINSIAVYFILTYGVIIDESMIGNIFNTNYEESSSFFSIKLLLFILILGILPSIYIARIKILKATTKKFLVRSSLSLLFLIILAFANASNWLWIDKNSKTLGGLAMPWSYSVNIPLYFIHKNQENQKEILLPEAKIKDNEKSIFVLVIGESARRENFSLYGYTKNTNPLLSKIENVHSFKANSCATYTTAGVKCILEHVNSNKLYEILPNYLYRNNVEVIWRSTNWGQPPLHIKNYLDKDALRTTCEGENCQYDEILLNGLKEQILASDKNKILVVLHTSTSHGPTYSKKYPSKFEVFKPVCNSVELGKCSQEELINAYDNTIVYTDYLLASVINDLKDLKDYHSTLLFVSDHGESLGEKNLYMHGVPMSIAPKEQYEIPFIVWTSDNYRQLKPNDMLSQNHVFHSVLNFLSIESPIYNEQMNIFK